MYPISQDVLSLFKKPYRQVAEITFSGQSETLTLTENDIIQGGLVLNRYSVSGSQIEIGSVIAGELELKLKNSDGRFDDIQFEGAELFVRVGVKKWNAPWWENAQMHYIPLGYFTVDESPRKLETITLTALDRMVLFDRSFDAKLITFPITVSALITRICEMCGVTTGFDPDDLPNHDYSVTAAPYSEELTYRQVLSWLAEITGTCGFIDWQGKLIFKWYESTGTVFDLSDRYESDLHENEIEITGIQIVNEDTVYLAGSDTYALNIEGNELIQHDYETVATALYGAIGGFSYTPFSATVKPMPHLYPLDIISFKDKSGSSHTGIITDVTFTLNGSTAIEGKGETETQQGWASTNPLTSRENAIIRSIQKQQNVEVSNKIQNVIALNELICNSLGLFSTPVENTDGSITYYLHDNPDLKSSNTIFTMTAAGVAWTTSGWNDGSPVWSYGVTAAGDALFHKLSAEGINVSKAGADYNIDITPSAFRIYYRDMLVTNIEADTMTIPKGMFTEYAQFGKIRFVPYSTVGTNIIFVD